MTNQSKQQSIFNNNIIYFLKHLSLHTVRMMSVFIAVSQRYVYCSCVRLFYSKYRLIFLKSALLHHYENIQTKIVRRADVYLFLLTVWKKLVRVDCFCGEACAEVFFWGDCFCRNVFTPPLVLERDGWNFVPLPPPPENAKTFTLKSIFYRIIGDMNDSKYKTCVFLK